MSAFDTEILATRMEKGRLLDEIPAGMMISSAPRRCARGRKEENLFVALSASAASSVSEEQLDALAKLLTRAYFDTPGSVTAALRSAFSVANEEASPYGLPSGPGNLSGNPFQLHCVIAVVKEQDLYFGYAGNTQAFVLRDASVEAYPSAEDAPSRPLGTSRNVDLKYGHTSISESMTLVLTATPQPTWTNIPSQLSRLSLQEISERMARQIPDPTPAMGAQASEPGALLIRFAKQTAPAVSAAPAAPAMLRSKPALGAQSAAPSPMQAELEPDTAVRAQPPAVAQPLKSSAPERPSAAIAHPSRELEPKLTVWNALFAFRDSAKATAQSVLHAIRNWFRGLMPHTSAFEESVSSISPNLMLVTAIAIPLVVVAVVGFLYFRKGREIEFDRLMNEARTLASVASASTDPVVAKQKWRDTIDKLDQASKYGSSDELTTLRNQAARTIDSFDGIVSLEFHPALAGGFDPGTRITSLIAGDRELYALDSSIGRVYRLVLGQGGYQIDESFLCQAGSHPEISVGNPIDIAWIPDLMVGDQQPKSARGGAIVALDPKGILLYCPTSGQSMAGQLKTPHTGWITPVAIEYYNNKLYVLDPGANGMWKYDYVPSESHFSDAPGDYLSMEQDHSILMDAMDFTLALGEVFLLHADGRVTHCEYDPLYSSDISASSGATICAPLTYSKLPPNGASSPNVENALFTRITYNDPPEPTLFFLDSFGRSAFRFSFSLNFYSRYRVTIAPETADATALAVGADKTLFIAIGNQIYFASTRSS